MRWNDYREEDYLHARLPVFTRRVEKAIEIAGEWLSRCERPHIACSGGKDSVAMTHLIRSAYGEVEVLFSSHPGRDWPGTYEVFERMGIEPRVVLNDPARQGFWFSDYDGCALGLRAGESRARMMNRGVRGALYYCESSGMLHCLPLSDWTHRDVFAYIAVHELPLHPIYSAPLAGLPHRGRIRLHDMDTTGEWWGVCGSLGAIWWIKKNFPEVYQQMTRDNPEVGRYA
jgi:3'-phosphoadenosine 5'-phosphosulfate sulfotransferase (PAPS reductase)/FAD synthetase